MAKIVWDDEGTRYFETGIDHGVLYLPFMPGMAWNGLVRVTESPSGGSAREFFQDGAKYLNLASIEEYSATIEAISAPKEFAAATGRLELSPGLLVSGQNRQSFAFSYRTLIGNDISGVDAGYKIHIVYNALAKMSDYVYQTSGDNTDINARSWSVITTPSAFIGGSPTAHYIIDTTQVDPDVVESIENVLYGTDIADPRLPTPSELQAMLQSVFGNIFVTVKKPSTQIFGSVGTSELSIATIAVKAKKPRIAIAGIGISAGVISVKVKKPATDIEGSTLPNPGLTGVPDLLPYLISSNAAGTGSTTIDLNVGDNNGWPVLSTDTIIVCGGSGGAQPTTITDTRSNTYTKRAGTNGTPASSIWSATANSSGLQTAAGPRGSLDKITPAYSGTGQAKQWIAFGCRNLGAVDLAPTPTTGTSAAPSITSGAPAVTGELVVVCVIHSNAGGTINTPAGWHAIAKNITSGSNALCSVFTKHNRTSSSVTFTGALTTSTTWSVCMTTYRPTLTPLRGIVGGSIFSASYPGELSPQDNWHAQLRFRSVTGRFTNSIKRYCDENDTAAGPSNDLEGIVGTWAANGVHQVIAVKPRRAVGGGNSTGDAFLRDSITWWRNNNIDAEILVGNEPTLNGLHGPFGDGTQKDWKLPSPYSGTTSAAEAAQNFQDYYLRYGRLIISSGYPAGYNPAISSLTPSHTFQPPRLDTDGHYLCCSLYIDYYFSGDFYPDNNITMDEFIAVADAMDPPLMVGLGEWGATDGGRRPLDDNPAGSRAAMVLWMDNNVTGLFKNRPANNLRNGCSLWYSNGLANALDTTTDISIIKGFRRHFDALTPS